MVVGTIREGKDWRKGGIWGKMWWVERGGKRAGKEGYGRRVGWGSDGGVSSGPGAEVTITAQAILARKPKNLGLSRIRA